MITLYTFGAMARLPGLPDPSMPCMKAEVLLKMAGLPYKLDHNGLGKAPKGKLPYLSDDGKLVADSTFIRWYLEDTYKIDFDKGLSDTEKATAWAFEKMCEEHLYPAMGHDRWLIDRNFQAGPAGFFEQAPALLRPLIAAKVRGDIRKTLHRSGMGRHSPDEITRLATRDIDAIAAQLGGKPYFMGAEPTGVDATILGFVASLLCKRFDTPQRTAAEGHGNLVAYHRRLMARYYPDLELV
jgi:glutathione S-transferase